MKKRVIVTAECSEKTKEMLRRCFGETCDLTFDRTPETLGDAEICIGEPRMELVERAECLRWVQMTWAGTDIYTRRAGFPENVMLTNASGAFGRTISEYVLAGILTMYRNLPQYREQQKHAVWQSAVRQDRARSRNGRPRRQRGKAPFRL